MRARRAADVQHGGQAAQLLSRRSPGSAMITRMIAALACAGLCSIAQAQDAAGTRTSPQPLVVPLVVNGTSREPVVVLVQDDEVWMAVSELEAAGLLPGRIQPGMARTFRGGQYVNLKDAAGLLSHRFDQNLLTLEINLRPDAMAVNVVDVSARARADGGGTSRAASAYLNYSFSGMQGSSPSLFLEAVGSLGGHTLAAYATRDSNGRAYRGPVSLTLNSEDTLRQIVVGDALWTGSGLLGSVPVGGVTLQSFFGFEPGFITTPTLDLRGFAATPSTVDVLVNGTLVGQRQIPAGPFELGNILAQAGSNDVSAVVRDAFGRETRFSGSGFYGSPVLLRPGLVSYSASLGRIRQDRAGQGPGYGDPVALAQAARGFDRSLTAGGAVQASGQFRALAGQLAATSDWGEFGAQLAHSRSSTGSGVALLMSWRLSTPVWGVSAALARRQRGFSDLGAQALTGDRMLRSAEFSVGRRYLGIDWGLRLTATGSAAGLDTRRISLVGSRRIGDRLNAIVELSRTTGAFPDTSLFLLASYALDAGQSASVSSTRVSGRQSTTLDVSRMPQQALSTGYRLSSTWAPDGTTRQTAQLTRDTTFGDYEVQATKSPAQSQFSWRASGAVLAIGGEVFAAPPIRDSFVLVRVPDAPQVPVQVEGRHAGQTNSRGSLVVPSVSAYSRQRVTIDTAALPLDYEVGSVEQRVSPPLRGGEIVEFEVKVYRAVTGRLVGADGEPAGSAIIVLGDGRRIATGTSGDFVVEGDLPQGEALAERTGQAGTCRIRFPAPKDKSPVQRLGELRCIP